MKIWSRLLCALPLFAMLASAPAIARDVTDSMGTVTVPDAPKRIVVLTNEGTEALLALGVTPVGAANSWNGDPWWDHISDAMDGAEPVGKESAVNLELIAALEPDLILANKQRHEEIYPQLTAIAPTVMSKELRGDWKINFRLYAEALGKEQEADAAIADYDASVADLREKLGDHLNEEVSVIRFVPGQIRIYQLDSFSGVLLKDIGFHRPANQNVEEFAIRTGKESIPDMDGDRIFYFTYDTGDGKGTSLEEEVLADPLWQSLSAVKAGKVHQVSDAIWNTAGGILAAKLMLHDIAGIYGLD
ncbi:MULTISPECIES: ABC transporter substrate-binding protein [Stappiaceae]|jgi:iron complex transport system substrate-binding protein|uniref:Putative siderophore-binding lipoprotein YfiY n=1 Tax=Roseibium aggregatum TaxID=187304 RepID=A0A0M6XYJ9_9HYPH|nr:MULTISPECIES: iron-siderophore ABC transporter substrate-binding protein [Stappiaceae]MBO6859604.1 iron-siderophore ABC transporter substrate-binding protein [Roseibium sp.]QFT68496.1 putative siderophore-binding lipoprotein YfiY precursor [Labrenzia sp. THAF35]UES58385.1 ABC transporter substrate-binding protein [Roseibium aggregatum]CTQ42931.1 putative siderophore-binding lipoprotein YfiY precursor [Roseibium aggregatum]